MNAQYHMSNPMKALIALLIAGLLLVAGCTGRRPESQQGQAPGDSMRTDSSAQVSNPAPQIMILTYEQRQGAFLYGKYCAICHGTEGKGDGFNAFNLDPRPRDFSDTTSMKALSNDQILQTVTGGGRSVNKSPLMPSYGWTLNKMQVRYIVAYLRTFATP